MRSHLHLPRRLLAVAICSIAVACGGGGGGGGSSTPNSGSGGSADNGGSNTGGSTTVEVSGVSPTAVTPTVSGTAAGPAAAGQAAATPLAQRSTPIAYDRQATPRLWVVNPDQDSVSVFNSSTQALIQEIPVGSAPRTLAVDNSGHVWVTNRGSGTISIISPDTLAVVTTITLSSAAQPYGVVAAPDGSGVWVSLIGSQELLQFDPVSYAVKQRVPVGPEVWHIAIDAASSRLLASRFISPPLPNENTATPTISGTGVRGGEVLLIDAASAKITQTIPLAVSTLADTAIQGRGLPNYLGAAAFSPDGNTAWVPSKMDNIQRGMLRDQRALDFQNTVRAIISRIDFANGSGTENIDARFDLDNSSLSSAIAYTPDGRYMLVSLETSRELAFMDTSNGYEVHRIVLGRAPQGVAVSPDGSQAAVSNFMDRSVSFLSLAPLADRAPNQIGAPTPVKSFTSAEKLSAQVLRGKQIFYDAFDVRLARDRYMSCATCHAEGYGDGRVWDMTGFGEGLRKTISLRGHGGKKDRVHWSGNFDEIQDFEQQIRNMAGGSGLMENYLADPRAAALGPAKAGMSTDLDALAAYVNSLSTYAPSPFRPADRSFSPAAKAGEALFTAKNCQSCHLNADLGGTGLVLENIGTLKPSSGTVSGQPLTGIVTPGLRDAWYNAPYLHDGSAATLDDAIKAHNNLTLTADEVTNLSAYVRELGNGQ